MIEGLDCIKSKGKYPYQGNIASISRGKNAIADLFKIKKECKSKTTKQLEKQS